MTFGEPLQVAEDAACIGFTSRSSVCDGEVSAFHITMVNPEGAVYYFERDDAGAWSEVTKLQASDKAPVDWFGFSLAMNDDFAVVGASREDTGAADAGAAYVYKLQRDPEEQIQDLVEDVQALDLPGNGGQAQLNAALANLAEDPPDIQGALDTLQAFINFVNAQSGKKIPVDEAAEIIAAAQAVVDQLMNA